MNKIQRNFEIKSSLKKEQNETKNELKNFSIKNIKQINFNNQCEIIESNGKITLNKINFNVNKENFNNNRKTKTKNEFTYAKNFYEKNNKNLNNNNNYNNKIEEDTITNTYKNKLLGKIEIVDLGKIFYN
jgi:hypothetical protein